MKKEQRLAFTIIEVLISVIILSGAIVFALKIHSQNREQILYISERNQHALEDSLFTGYESLKYHKSTKNSYEVLQKTFKISNYESRAILKKISRQLFIPPAVNILPPDESGGFSAKVEEIDMKDTYSTSFFHFTFQ